ncbi:MAG: hypothetical protein WC071_06515 [Victivallaceae bacterium]
MDKTIFNNGSCWLKADFHLHTKADDEFTFAGDENYYISNYVDKLEEQNIRVGVIANHNKFDFAEFKDLQKNAGKKGIYLLPGVELSVSEGSSGVHVLVVFAEEWISDGKDRITPLLATMFLGKSPSEYQNENGRSDKNLIQTVAELEKCGREYFLVFAHVEENKGLWKEMFTRLDDWNNATFDAVRKRTLGFQKVRTYDNAESGKPDRKKVQTKLGSSYPAEVEGSDAKSIEEIVAKTRECFVKIGDFTFESIEFALSAYENRVSTSCVKYKHSYIQNISFKGGLLNDKVIHFSPEMNSLIGIRGSGKSSIIETIRYALDFQLGNETQDKSYKDSLVRYVLGSSGKIIISAKDKLGQVFSIERILGNNPQVYIDGKLQPAGVSIRETILNNPMYFGQKDLSSRGDGFEKDLVEKLVGEKLYDVRRKIDLKCQQIRDDVQYLKRLQDVDEQKKEQEGKKQDAEFRIQKFKEYGLDKKLALRVGYNSDLSKLNQILSKIAEFIGAFDEVFAQYEDDLRNAVNYVPKQNSEFWKGFYNQYGMFLLQIDSFKKGLLDIRNINKLLLEKKGEFGVTIKNLQEEFATIERKLSAELSQQDAMSLRPDEFVRQQQIITTAAQMLEELEKAQTRRLETTQTLKQHLAELENLYHEEFVLIEKELSKVNATSPALKITSTFRGDKKAYLTFFTDMFRGSKIRGSTLEGLVDGYADFTQMYLNWNATKQSAGSSPDVFEQYFLENLYDLLVWQVPNAFSIEYHGKELKSHSLGQRASALILFVLSQHDNDVIIIDQPEDDLDNQTIYEDVIKLIVAMKPKVQFIFATHNANIPVLGDSDQVIACDYLEDQVGLTIGSIDNPEIQGKIVRIMEGGEEAFNKRKEIYSIWNPQK